MLKQEIVRGYLYLKNKGLGSTIIKARRHIKEQASYHRRPALDVNILEKQRRRNFKYKPKISVIVPLYKTPEVFLKAMIDSVIAQTYSNWELCLADGTAEKSDVFKIVESYAKKDKRIKYKLLDSNDGISGNTNKALEMATGEYVALFDHDDLLTPDALYEIVRALNKNKLIDTIYTDEDKTDAAGKVFSMPHFKPDYNPDYFMANNYICHFFITKRSIANEVGGFNKKYDGAQDFDFICKCIEKSDVVYHIPKVLYHWRCHSDSTAGRPESKLYAYENGIKVVSDHYDRCGINAKVSMYPEAYGYYKTEYIFDDVMISIIFVGKNQNKKRQISYPHQEYYINAYNAEEINEIIEKQENRFVLILDNSMEIDDVAIKNLVGTCMREQTAVAGGRIYDKRKRLAFGGLVLGVRGYFGYSFEGTSEKDRGYYLRINVPQNTMGVDIRCMMIDKDYFMKVGGLSNDFDGIMCGIDYCLKIVFSTGRGVTYAADSIARSCASIQKNDFSKEKINHFKEVWGKRIEKGDPFYNRNLSLNNTSYSLVKAKNFKNGR